MRTAADIEALLPVLDNEVAANLEAQDLDFKQWDTQSRRKAIKIAVDIAVCMANGGGGTVVFGVADKARGRAKAILGIPLDVDIILLKKAIYDQTDPKITADFEDLLVSEGTGRLLLMQIHPGFPPYTDTAGRGTLRVGKDCQPLTGTLRRQISVAIGNADYTAEPVAKVDTQLLSATALEALRNQARREQAPDELLNQTDVELLGKLGLIKGEEFTRAALLLAGTETAIREYLPGHNWTFLQMRSDTDYGIRKDGISALPLAIQTIEQLLLPFNPITTYQQGLYHYEYRTWPEIAVREALMNAFSHADLRLSGPVMIKLYPGRLEISNNGSFIAGISPENILHHPPVARNPLLVEALTRLRLVNRANLGISRMFRALLIEGKEFPAIRETGESIQVSFPKRELMAPFRFFVAEESKRGRDLGVDELLLLRHLLQHPDVDAQTAAELCQRSGSETRECLSAMEALGYIEHGGVTPKTYWRMVPNLYEHLTETRQGEARRHVTREVAKARVLSILQDHTGSDEPSLSNKDIRQITGFSRDQAYELMVELRRENSSLQLSGRGRYARYRFQR